MNDKDVYFFRRKELVQVLNDLCSTVESLRDMMDEERKLSCVTRDEKDSEEIDF